MDTNVSPAAQPSPDLDRQRALVLGGGGSAGNAWLIGVVAGLFDAGVVVTAADLVIGTSAGSTAAVQLASSTPSELLAAILTAPAQPPSSARTANPPGRDHLERTGRIIAAAQDAVDMRRRMGAAAIELAQSSDQDRDERWRATVAARLPTAEWPTRTVLVTAVDARTGEPVTFDRHGPVSLADAVAASTSSGAAYRIGDNVYIDGGYRRNENADLAKEFGRVLVLSPLGGRTRHPREWRMQLAAQVEDLEDGGSRVETILPDANSRNAFGDDLMNPAARRPAAQAGYDQGRARASDLRDFWA